MSLKAPSGWRAIAFSFWTIALAVTLLRVAALVVSPAQLGPDESQYWFWSRDLAFGYFSKPPFIAWAIAAATALFGNEEWAVRLAAPLFHFGASAFLYLTARRLFDQPIAYWTGLAWLTMPGVALSSFVMTTDAPLLFFWSAALFVCFSILLDEKPRIFLFAALGGAVGLGFLSKYAMIYFIIAFGASAALFPEFRKAFLRRELIITAIIAATLVAPNVAWNAAHDFQTVAHTAANANWDASLFKPFNFLSFFGEQLAVAGPLFFAGLIWCAARQLRSGEAASAPTGALYLFALTPLVIVSIQAFISRAHANWAAAAYPTAIIIVTAWLYQHRAAWLARASVIIQATLAVIFVAAISNFSLIDRLGFSDAVRSLRGWKEQSDTIAAMAGGYDAVMLDDRPMMGAMLYYQRNSGLEIVAIDPNNSISTHYEAFKAFDPETQNRVLFVTSRSDAAHVDYRFHNITPVGAAAADFGAKPRIYTLFDVSDYFGPDAPQRED